MSKTNFTKVPLKRWAFVSLLLLLLGQGQVVAQALACNNSVQVSVDNTPNLCQATITADMILEGNPIAGDDYEITIKLNNVVIATGINEVTVTGASQYFGATLVTTITHLNSGISCWGTMFFEDKLAPSIDCSDATVNCSEYPGGNIPLPTAVDNCDPSPSISLTNEVVYSQNVCANGYATVERTYIAFDAEGNTSAPCTQTIYVERPDLVDFPNDIIWTCNQYAAYPNIVDAGALHPYITDTDNTSANVIDVNLDEDCDDSDQPNIDLAHINSTNLQNGGNGCPGNGLDDADVLELTGSGVVANVIGQYCNYQTSHSDQTLQTCGNTFKIVRTWTVLDWCTGSVITSGVGGEDNIQIIKVVDNVQPFISRAPFNVSANIPGIHPQPCRSQGLLLPPTAVTDNCNTVEVKIYTPVGEANYVGGNGINGGFIPAPGLPIGTHTVTYQATDACGNQTTLDVPVTVVDDIAPTTICDEITDVNLSTNGIAIVSADVFDDGTHDNCCLDHFEVRRMVDGCDDGHDDTIFGPSVIFCCDDLDNNPVMVVFRAFDCDNNYNDCMIEVEVNDKISPALINCPANERVLCDWYADNLETQLADLEGDPVAQSELLDQYFGEALFQDNCEYELTRTFSENIDQCLEGVITRGFDAVDDSGNEANQSCTQLIYVDHVSDWVIEFPEDILVNCGTTVPDFGEPEVFFETCELVAVSYDDVIYTTVPDACYKIARTWNVINWCVVGANIDEEVAEDPENQLGLPFPQCDLDGDGDCDDRTFRDSWTVSAKPTAANANQNTNPDTDLDSDPWDGYIEYEQIIKVIDEIDPVFADDCQIDDVCINGNSCGATLLLPEPAIDDCSPDIEVTVEILIGGTWIDGFGPYQNVAPGTYDVRYMATDNCNNQSTCETTVTVVDCKKPTPYCKNGIIVELMDVDPAMVQIWASDLNAGSFDNCPGDVGFSFSALVSDDNRTYTCDDVGQNPVQMWVTDAAGNQDYCETFVTIQANMGQCGDDPLVSVGGAVATEDEQFVEGVDVVLSNQSTGTTMTDNGGVYNFGGIPVGSDVTVTPEKDNDPLNGVTTFDLVIITKHILGVTPLDTPYKMIAADANNSGAITTADLVELRKLILQIIPSFSNNSSWRFVEKAYVFPDQNDPWFEPFPEAISINDIDVSVLDADFTAVKIGDVNGSAATNLGGSNDDRTTFGTFILNVDDMKVQEGEVFTVEFSCSDYEVVASQFTLNFENEALELMEVVEGVAGSENFGLTLLDEGAVTSSWNTNGETGEAVGRMFSLVFKAKQNGKLSQMVSLNSRFTRAEAYNANGELYDVALNFNGNTASGFELYQNVPNPFNSRSAVGFNLPEAGPATLTITDVSGKVLNVTNGDFAEGYNEITINKTDLPSFGVLYYTLETASETASKKMVVVE